MDYTGSRLVDSLRVQAQNLFNIAGGVGPMTVAMLMHNTVEAASRTVGKAIKIVPYFYLCYCKYQADFVSSSFFSPSGMLLLWNLS